MDDEDPSLVIAEVFAACGSVAFVGEVDGEVQAVAWRAGRVDVVRGEEVADPVQADEDGVEVLGHPGAGRVEEVGFLGAGERVDLDVVLTGLGLDGAVPSALDR
ncbi:hypothetical protein ACFWDF_34315 [Streptomyces diastaticus]|uniref:hypothetical protein n=1 Tax=Streptomyces diastaticus TaxID=1956 RepID=UPI0013C1BE12|nr:hypothetical protein [Streptomyces sp. SID7982]